MIRLRNYYYRFVLLDLNCNLFYKERKIKMEVVVGIASLVLGTITYKITTRNSIGTTGAYIRRWFICVVIWFFIIGLFVV